MKTNDFFSFSICSFISVCSFICLFLRFFPSNKIHLRSTINKFPFRLDGDESGSTRKEGAVEMTTTPGSGAPSSGSRGSYNHGMNETSLSGSDEENKSERASSAGYSATEYPMVCCYDCKKSCDHELTVCSYQHINFHLILHSSSLFLALSITPLPLFLSPVFHSQYTLSSSSFPRSIITNMTVGTLTVNLTFFPHVSSFSFTLS